MMVISQLDLKILIGYAYKIKNGHFHSIRFDRSIAQWSNLVRTIEETI